MLEHNFVMIEFDRIDMWDIRVYFGSKHGTYAEFFDNFKINTAKVRGKYIKKDYTMAEVINESVSVNLLFNHLKRSVMPTSLFWHGRRYTIAHVGLHHFLREGRVLVHIFSVTDGTTFFRLRFDTETLSWKLLEIENATI